MKFLTYLLAAGTVTALAAPPRTTNSSGATAQMVVTVRPAPSNLQADDVTVIENKARVPVTRIEKLAGDMANMQLFILLDDSSRSQSLGPQLPEIKAFVRSLPATTEVAIGYMRNGSYSLAQHFTSDHEKASGTVRLPLGVPGENGSPYFALKWAVDHWPSGGSLTGRRAILTLTDGVDRYYTNGTIDDPYADAAIDTAVKHGVQVYSIYLRGAGLYGRGWGTDVAQSRLMQVSEQSGGYAYFEGLSNPVSIAPFLSDLTTRFDNQYRLTLASTGERGIQTVKLRTELQGVKIEGPTRIFVP